MRAFIHFKHPLNRIDFTSVLFYSESSQLMQDHHKVITLARKMPGALEKQENMVYNIMKRIILQQEEK